MYKYLAVFSSNVFIQILVALNPCKSVQCKHCINFTFLIKYFLKRFICVDQIKRLRKSSEAAVYRRSE